MSNVVEARLAASSVPLQALLGPEPLEPKQGHEILTLWRFCESASSTAGLPAPVDVEALYTPIDTANPAAVAKTLQAMSDAMDAATQHLGYLLDAMPLVQGGDGAPSQGEMVWPPDHNVGPCCCDGP